MLLCFSWKWLSQFLFWFVFLLGEGEGGELVVFFPCAGKKKGRQLLSLCLSSVKVCSLGKERCMASQDEHGLAASQGFGGRSQKVCPSLLD